MVYSTRPSFITPLVLATLALVVNFWAWALLGPLATQYAQEFKLSPSSVAILLAAPVLVGSIGRIVIGMLTDRYGGRIIFSLLCFATAVPVFSLMLVQSYFGLLAVGVLLGISGTSFAVGIPYLNGWVKPENRGLALGLYSMGNAGTAVSGLLTPQLADLWGRDGAFLFLAIVLVVVGTLFYFFAHNAPGWQPAVSGSALGRFKDAITSIKTWDMAIVYAVTFGAFVSFAMYLPVLLEVWYQLDPIDASLRAAGFVALATLSRPLGGWLSDVYGGRKVILAVLSAMVVLATVISMLSDLSILTTISFLTMASMLGLGSGAVIALTSNITEPTRLGGVNGIVGAVGGLGGFLPPLVLGYTYELTNSYALSLVLLAVTALVVLVYIYNRFRSYS